MKKLILLLTMPAYLFFAGCGNHTHDHDTHDHHTHEANDHSGHAYGPDGAVAAPAAHDDHSGEIAFSNAQAEAVGLEVETVEPGPFHQVIKTSGRVQAATGDEVAVAAPTAGIVRFANRTITEGAQVGRGQTVATISASGIADGDPVVKARITYQTAEKELRRADGLVADRIISQKDYEQAVLNYETAKIAYEALGSSATASGVAVASPMGGYIKNILVSEGSYVAVGDPIATISQNRRLQLRAEVSQKYFGDLRVVRGANFKLPYSDRIYKLDELNGRLLSFGRSAGDDSFYVPVTFEFDNVGDVIPGSFAEIYLISRSMENVISISVDALTEEQGLYFVYLRVHDEDYVKREVRPGASDGTRVEIVSGLHTGDVVVTKGAMQVKLASAPAAIPDGHGHSH